MSARVILCKISVTQNGMCKVPPKYSSLTPALIQNNRPSSIEIGLYRKSVPTLTQFYRNLKGVNACKSEIE